MRHDPRSQNKWSKNIGKKLVDMLSFPWFCPFITLFLGWVVHLFM